MLKSLRLFEQTQQIDLLSLEKQVNGRTLIVQISQKQSNYHKDLEALASLYTKGDLSMAIEKPFWKEIREYYYRADNLFHNTLEWLKKT